jgi:peptidoglycan/xylan/chitin deacetylase (PgdA/CDA1 family)
MILKQTLRYLAIRLALECISFFKLGALFPKKSKRGVIFTLHHVRPKPDKQFDPNAILEVTPEFLEVAILAAKEAGLEPVRLEDLPILLAETNSDRQFVCFTLDDGYRNNAQYAAPIFRKHNVPYTIFICPGFVERKRTMWWETSAELLSKIDSFSMDFGNGPELITCKTLTQKKAAYLRLADFVNTHDENEAVARIDKMARANGLDPMLLVQNEIMDQSELRELAQDPLVTLGGHTLTHCNLARVSVERLAQEITQSCALVTGYSGKKTTTFAYPYGWKSAATQREFSAALRCGLDVAVTTQPGVLSARAKPTALNRVSLNGLYQKKRYVEALLSGIPF